MRMRDQLKKSVGKFAEGKQKRKPYDFLFAVRAGFEPAVRLPVRQFSKLVVSATHPSHQNCPVFSNGTAKI